MFQNVRSALASATAWAGGHGINAVHISAEDASWVEAFPALDVLREEAQTNTPEQARVVAELPPGREL